MSYAENVNTDSRFCASCMLWWDRPWHYGQKRSFYLTASKSAVHTTSVVAMSPQRPGRGMKRNRAQASKREATPRRSEKGFFLGRPVLFRVGQAQLQRCCRGTAFEIFQRKWLLDKPPPKRHSLANGGSVTYDPLHESTARRTPLYHPKLTRPNFTPFAPPHSSKEREREGEKRVKFMSFILLLISLSLSLL